MTRTNAAADPETLAARLPEVTLAAMRMQAALIDAGLRQGIEWLDFMRARLDRDRQLAARLATLTDPAEATELWSAFWSRAAEDYAAEPVRLSAAVQTAVTDAVARARHDAAELGKSAHSTAV